MIRRFSHKMTAMVSSSHTECGALQLTDHFIRAHSVAGNTTAASLIAAIPCMRHIASRIKAKWRGFWSKIA